MTNSLLEIRPSLPWLVLGLAFGLVSCGGSELIDPAGRPLAERALFDQRHVPEVLTEVRRLATPPATSGNRFVAGWWPWRSGGHDVLTALDGGARLELIHLEQRPRTLVLDLLDEEPPATGAVRVAVAGGEPVRLPLSDPLVLELPAELPLGRVRVEILPETGTKLTVLAASMRTALAAGDTRFEGADALQTGHSVVDAVRRVEAGSVLSGTFRPPASPREGQEFVLQIEAAGRWQTAFSWRGTLWNRLRGARRIEVPLGAESGWVRIRFVVRGEGPAARWQGFAIHSPTRAGVTAASPPGAAGDASEPPRLVIVYVMDALRADQLGHLGGPAEVSPTLDRLAREGLTFTQHRSVAPNTLPSTKALFTGEAYADRGGWKLPADGPATLAEAYRDAGYATALFSNNPYVSATYGVGRGFDHLVAPVADGSVPFHDDAARIHAAALEWLSALAEDQPAFVYLHTLHPHNPYDPPPAYAALFTAGIASDLDGSTPTLLDIQRFRREPTAADRQRLAGLYAAGLAYNDAELDKLLAAVAERYPPEETVIAATSDHGEELFEHSGVLHGYTLYEEMIRIPLVLWAPGRVAAGRRAAATSTLDLHATLLEIAGAPQGVSEGRSLLRADADAQVWQAEPIHFAAASSVEGGVFSAQSSRYKLVLAPRTGRRWGMGEALGRSRDAEYLFDLQDDPGEQINRAGLDTPEVAWLRSRLLAWIDGRRAAPAVAPEVDAATRERLEALGYVD
ncbi:MAG: sulfatase [Acidobacteriota bacterium]